MSRSLSNAVSTLVLFVAAFLANQRLLGPSPIVWVDTVNDEGEVRRCVGDDSCTLRGMSTAIPGQAAAVAWLELRTLLAWLGVGLDGAHRAIQLLNAVAVVLVFHLASRLANPLAGAAAALLFLGGVGSLVPITALHNSSLLFFLGAVFVLACSAVIERPGFASVGLAALVGAIMANVHLACLLTGPAVVWVALAAPRRRLRLAAFGAGLFVLASFAIAPPLWLSNLMNLLGQGALRDAPMAAVSAGATRSLLGWSLFGLAAWAVSFFRGGPAWSRYRRRGTAALAVLVPLVAVFLAAPSFGLSPEAKYLIHVKAACAVAAALPLGLAAGALLRSLLPRRVFDAFERGVPFAVAALLALAEPLGLGSLGASAGEERTPTVDDLASIGRILRDERGWDVTRELARLKSPYGAKLLWGLRQENAASAVAAPTADADGVALLLVLDAEDLPRPLPAGWRVVSRRGSAATLLVLTSSRVDWTRFVVCARPADESPERCEESGWHPEESSGTFVPHMPPTGWRGRIEIRMAVRPPASDSTTEIFMPRMSVICGGRISSRSGEGLLVGDDGRHATILPLERDATSPPAVAMEWEIGSPECAALSYDGLVPFFVEGEPATVSLLEAILRRSEG